MNGLLDLDNIRIMDITGATHVFGVEVIDHYDFEYSPEILRIDFRDYSFVEFYKRNIISVEVNKKVKE